jgi:hypothetical protein
MAGSLSFFVDFMVVAPDVKTKGGTDEIRQLHISNFRSLLREAVRPSADP